MATPSRIRIEGYPLASLQFADEGRYISELNPSQEEQLWQSVLGEPLRRLVVTALLAIAATAINGLADRSLDSDRLEAWTRRRALHFRPSLVP